MNVHTRNHPRNHAAAARTARRIAVLAISCVSLLIGAVALGCAGDGPPPGDTPPDTVRAAASGAETFFRYSLVPLGDGRDGVRAEFGEPDSVDVTAVQNRHDPTVTDSVAMLYYPGIAVEFYVVTLRTSDLATKVIVTDNRHIPESAPVRIGMPASELTSVMGPATTTDGGTYVYLCDTCTEVGNDHVIVRTAAGRVSAIIIEYSID